MKKFKNNQCVYKICHRCPTDYDNKEWYVCPYSLGGTVKYLGKRKWWYRSKKKAQRIVDRKNGKSLGNL